MGRLAVALVSTEAERADLSGLASRRNTAQALALRARIVLACSHQDHVDLRTIGARTAFCYVAAACGAVVLGRLVFRNAVSPCGRRFVVATCLAGSANVGFLPDLHGTVAILAVLSLSLCCLIAANGADTAMLTDLIEDGRKIGSVTGLTLTSSNGLGLFAPIVTGYIVAFTNRFDIAWYGCAALVLASAASILLVRGPIRMA